MRTRASLVASVLLLVTTSARTATAEPRWNTGLVAGVAGAGRGSVWPDTNFYGSLHGDVVFGRSSDRDVGIGPSLELSTVGFSDLRGTAGALVLLPVGDQFALGVTPGVLLRSSAAGGTFGLSGHGFFGIRNYNYTGGYDLALGAVVGYDQDLGAPHHHALFAGIQVDGFVLALPILLFAGWLRGGR